MQENGIKCKAFYFLLFISQNSRQALLVKFNETAVENDTMIEYEYFPWCQLEQLDPIKDDEDNMWWGWSWARTSQARPILTSSAVSFPRTQGPHTAAAHKALSSFQALSQSLFSLALSLIALCH